MTVKRTCPLLESLTESHSSTECSERNEVLKKPDYILTELFSTVQSPG